MIYNGRETYKKFNEYKSKHLGEYLPVSVQAKNEEINKTHGLMHFMNEAGYEKIMTGEPFTLQDIEDTTILYLFGKLAYKLIENQDYDLDTILTIYEEEISKIDTKENVEVAMSSMVFPFLNYFGYVQNNKVILWSIGNVDTPTFVADNENPEYVGELVTSKDCSMIDTIHFLIDETKKLESKKSRI